MLHGEKCPNNHSFVILSYVFFPEKDTFMGQKKKKERLSSDAEVFEQIRVSLLSCIFLGLINKNRNIPDMMIICWKPAGHTGVRSKQFSV